MLFLPFLAGVAGKAALGWAGSKLLGGLTGSKKSKREKRSRKKFDQAIDAESERGTRFSDEYEDRALNYDAQDALEESVTGAWGNMLPEIRASQVGAGRLRTGFGAQDENKYLSNLIASKAMDSERLNFQNMRDIGDYGERARDRTLDALFGTYATERQAREQGAASKRGMWGNIIGSGIGAAGRILASR